MFLPIFSDKTKTFFKVEEEEVFHFIKGEEEGLHKLLGAVHILRNEGGRWGGGSSRFSTILSMGEGGGLPNLLEEKTENGW